MRTGRPPGRPLLDPDDPLGRPLNINLKASTLKCVDGAARKIGVSRAVIIRYLLATDLETRLPQAIEACRRTNDYGNDVEPEPEEPPHITWNVYVCSRGSQRIADKLLGTIEGRCDARGLISTAFDRWHHQRHLGSQQFFFEEAAPAAGMKPRTKLEA